MKTVTFFNNKGGVGKTSLVFHVAMMFRDMGLRVLAADFDPQANLSSIFIDEERLEQLWPEGLHDKTLLGAIDPIDKGTGDIAAAHIENVWDSVGLLVGDLGLSAFEDKLSAAWPRCQDGDEAAFRTTSAFSRIIESAGREFEADIALIDVGPNLGAINRACLIATQHVVIPLAPDLYSLQGLRNLGPTLRRWRREWNDRLHRNVNPLLLLPNGEMEPAGYVVMQSAMRLDRPVKAYARWMSRIPGEYARSVLNKVDAQHLTVQNDPSCLKILKNYRSLMPLAMEARRPMFSLRAADGAIGAHQAAVKSAFEDFYELSVAIARSIELPLPSLA
jgi:chromosome partitioning protein